jgi:hypothetical protein
VEFKVASGLMYGVLLAFIEGGIAVSCAVASTSASAASFATLGRGQCSAEFGHCISKLEAKQANLSLRLAASSVYQ